MMHLVCDRTLLSPPPVSFGTIRDGPKVRLYYSAVVTERVPHIRPNYGRRLSLLGKTETQH